MGVMNDAEVLRVQKALVSRDTAIIKAVITQVENEHAQAPVLDEVSQTLTFRGRSVRLNDKEYRFVHFLGWEHLGEEIRFREIDQAIGVSGYLTPKYSCHIASSVRDHLRRLGFKPYGVLQTDHTMGTYRWNPVARMTFIGKAKVSVTWTEQPSA